MNSRRNSSPLVPLFALLAFAALALAPASRAGLMDAVKAKITEKATKKAEGAVDKSAEAADKVGKKKSESGKGEEGKTEEAESASASSEDGGKVSSVSTKFDYVPGDKVRFLDDFTQDELGEFPVRWKLVIGTFEVAEMEGERWLRCVSRDGMIRLKLGEMASLPEFWTLEFDFYGEEPMGSALGVRALGPEDHVVWEAYFPAGKDMSFRTGEVFSSTTLEGESVPGRHHVMFMARGTAIKAYIDRQRMASVPEIATHATPAQLEIRLSASTKPMITNVRFAEGCRPAKDMLAEGKLVTYGIRFATGSDVVMPESAPVLRQVASYLEANSAVKLNITGHTDNVGSAESNLDLSRRRAASVAKILAEQFGVSADRLETDGKGDTQSLATNAKPEGRAMNRRVEFAKL